MKKAILTLSIAFMAILAALIVPSVHATEVNLFDPSKVSADDTGTITYTDSTLPDGSYSIIFTIPTSVPYYQDEISLSASTFFNGDESLSLSSIDSIGGTFGRYGEVLKFENVLIYNGSFWINLLMDQGQEPFDFSSAAFTTSTFSIVQNVVDTIDPVFTYSSAEVNTSYTAPTTVATIKSGITATDANDGNLTAAIEIYEDTYTAARTAGTLTVGGDYYVMFRVADAAGNYAYLNVDINVTDTIKPYLTYAGTTYQNGATITLPFWYDDSNATAKLTLEEIKALFTYGDGYYSAASLTKVASCATSNYYDIPGNYNITLTVTDGSGNASVYTIAVQVKTNANPVVVGPATQVVEITSFSFASILAQYSGTDTEDTTASISVDASNTWNYGSPALGSFTLILRATDSLGAYVTKSIAVTVRDTTIPVFSIGGSNVTTYDFTVNMSNTAALQTLINSIVITDAYYGVITSSKVVPTLPSFTVPATTALTITCTDASGNVGSLTLNVTVADDILPVISGPTKVVKGQTVVMTVSEITSQLSATDNISGTRPIVLVSDGYTGNSNKIGSYLVRYSSTDAAGNIAYRDVRVWVLDNVPAVWGFDDTFFNVSAGTSMTRTEIVALLQASGKLATNLSYHVTFVTDEYYGNEEIAGAYDVVMHITYEDGSESEISIQLTVPEPEDEPVVIVEPEPEPEARTGLQQAWDKVKAFFISSWDWILTAANWIKTSSIWLYDHILLPVWNFLFVKDTPTTTLVPGSDVTTTLPPVETTTTSGIVEVPYTSTTGTVPPGAAEI